MAKQIHWFSFPFILFAYGIFSRPINNTSVYYTQPSQWNSAWHRHVNRTNRSLITDYWKRHSSPPSHLYFQIFHIQFRHHILFSPVRTFKPVNDKTVIQKNHSILSHFDLNSLSLSSIPFSSLKKQRDSLQSNRYHFFSFSIHFFPFIFSFVYCYCDFVNFDLVFSLSFMLFFSIHEF